MSLVAKRHLWPSSKRRSIMMGDDTEPRINYEIFRRRAQDSQVGTLVTVCGVRDYWIISGGVLKTVYIDLFTLPKSSVLVGIFATGTFTRDPQAFA